MWHNIRSLHGHGTIDHLGSINFSYVWLCNWEHPFSTWLEGESPKAVHTDQALPWRTTPTRCGIMRFLCTPAAQLVDQPCTFFSSAIGSKTHHQRPQPTSFSQIRWLELLPTSYETREISLVSFEHNRKTKRCLAHLCLLPKSTHLSRRWTRLGVLSCFNHLGWTKPRKKKKGYRFQIGTTNHTKVIRLERNILLEKGMDLNSLTWLLVTSVLFQMYTTPTLIQSTCTYGNETTWHLDQVHLLIFNTLHFTLSVRGGKRYHVIWLKLFPIHLEVHQLLEKQLQPFTNLRS
jgi:hypothetical protein